ncbi:MAG: RidA family protein [Propionibacteriaceae bacterium]|jgi:enamine deaminase RidA (YjgF/YER057c/UK114 family)|nr:RidA family protein [Propionibacteriaceae bacterium]
MNEELNEVPVSQRLAELGVTLPAVPTPVAAYVPAITASGQVITSGQLPFVDGKLPATGKLGAEITVAQGQELARIAALNALAAAASVVEGVDGLRRILKLTVYVNSAPGFTDQPAVANGASEFLIQVFGSRGRHARTAIGVAELPMNTPVELDLVAEANAASF